MDKIGVDEFIQRLHTELRSFKKHEKKLQENFVITEKIYFEDWFLILKDFLNEKRT